MSLLVAASDAARGRGDGASRSRLKRVRRCRGPELEAFTSFSNDAREHVGIVDAAVYRQGSLRNVPGTVERSVIR
jgi:hypothetical protein